MRLTGADGGLRIDEEIGNQNVGDLGDETRAAELRDGARQLHVGIDDDRGLCAGILQHAGHRHLAAAGAFAVDALAFEGDGFSHLVITNVRLAFETRLERTDLRRDLADMMRVAVIQTRGKTPRQRAGA